MWKKWLPLVVVLTVLGAAAAVLGPRASDAEPMWVHSSDSNTAGEWGFYGAALAPVDGVGNIRIYDRNSVRFTAKHSGEMIGFDSHWAFQTAEYNNLGRSGYSKGDGGIIEIRLVPDDGFGFPDEANALSGTITKSFGLVDGVLVDQRAADVAFQTLTWPDPVRVEAGKTYHILYQNVHPDPAHNWISSDHGWSVTDGVERGGVAPSNDAFGLTKNDYRTGHVWSDWTNHSDGQGRYDPSVTILMNDESKSYGNGYVGFIAPITLTPDGVQVRQTFSPPQDQAVRNLSILTEGAGTMHVVLTGPGIDYSTSLQVSKPSGSVAWADHYVVSLGSTLILKEDETYTLTLSADSDLTLFFASRGEASRGRWSGAGAWGDTRRRNRAEFSVNHGRTWDPVEVGQADLVGVAFGVD